MKQKSIAFFDFDGTITNKDSMLELIKFYKGNFKYSLGLLQLSPYLLAMKLGLVSNTTAKEKMLTHFFKGISIDDFKLLCYQFSIKKIPNFIKPKALEKIEYFQQNNTEVVIVSASADWWLADWCTQKNIKCIATQLQVENKTISGKLNGKNCSGEEKVNRIKQLYLLNEYTHIYCFGDTKSDKQMLRLATSENAFYKYF
jgi:phosphatidylglycerophosphatase C